MSRLVATLQGSSRLRQGLPSLDKDLACNAHVQPLHSARGARLLRGAEHTDIDDITKSKFVVQQSHGLTCRNMAPTTERIFLVLSFLSSSKPVIISND